MIIKGGIWVASALYEATEWEGVVIHSKKQLLSISVSSPERQADHASDLIRRLEWN